MSTAALKTAVAGAQAQKPAGLPALLQQMRPQLALALPKHLNPDRMVRIALTELRKNPALNECNAQTVLASVVIASQLGLEPGINGQGYLIPYKGTCTFVPGWKGLVDLAQRSGRASVWTGAVFDGDEFDYEYGTKPYLKHKPGAENDPAKMTHAYAVGWVRGAEYPVVEVWPVAKVWKHRDRFNKVGRSHYSFNHPEMYARKVALLQVLKYMPQSIELATAMDLENAAEAGRQNLDLNEAIEGTFTPAADPPPEQPGAATATEPTGAVTPITEAQAIERFRAAKTEADIEAVWRDVVGSYPPQSVPLPIEAARNTFRDELKRKAEGGK